MFIFDSMKYFVCLLLLLTFGCKKDKNPATTDSPAPAPTNDKNSVSLVITNVAGNTVLKISKDSAYTGVTPKYINANNDTFSVSMFRYYISNIKLKKSDGNYYTETESYHLVDAKDSANTCRIALSNVPVGTYISAELMIGVDSTRNCSGAQSGDLDPAKDMFWSWNQGYIFMKFEGYSASAPAASMHNVEYHIGGFKNPYNNSRKVVIPLSTSLQVVTDHSSKILLKANVLEVFRTPTVISFSATPVIASPNSAVPLANNYADMLTLAAVIN
jgi:hypothetical protein